MSNGNAGDAEVKDLHAALAELSEEKPGTFDAIAEASDGMLRPLPPKAKRKATTKGKNESCSLCVAWCRCIVVVVPKSEVSVC